MSDTEENDVRKEIPKTKRYRRRLVIAGILSAVIIGCGGAYVLSQQPSQPEPLPKKPVTQEQPAAKASKTQADKNASHAPKEDAEAVEKKDEVKQEADGDKPASKPAAPASETTKNETVVNNNGSSNGSTQPSQPAQPSQPSQPAHQHTWVAQTSQQWVSNNVWVQDSPAWDEPVYTYGHVCNNPACPSFNSIVDTDHLCAVRVDKIQTGTIHHEATGHYEDRGWYETVTTGYICSSCGAAK